MPNEALSVHRQFTVMLMGIPFIFTINHLTASDTIHSVSLKEQLDVIDLNYILQNTVAKRSDKAHHHCNFVFHDLFLTLLENIVFIKKGFNGSYGLQKGSIYNCEVPLFLAVTARESDNAP